MAALQGKIENELVLKLHVAPGKLTVQVVRAHNLEAKDDNGFSDPYVTLDFQKKSKKTKVIKKNLNPVWGEQFEFGFALNGSPLLFVKVWDHDVVGSNDFIGEECIDVTRQTMACDLSIPLKKRGGAKRNETVYAAAVGTTMGLSGTSMPSLQGQRSAPSAHTPQKGKSLTDIDYERELTDQNVMIAFRVVQTDPRYIRLSEKLDPKFRSKNMLKTMVDPSNIPYAGHVVNAKRSGQAEKNRALLKKVKEADSDNTMLDSTYDVLEGNMKTECATRHLTLGMGLAFQAMPASVLLPGVGDAAAASVSGVAASGIAAAMSPGLEVAGQAGVVVTTATVQAVSEGGVEVATVGGKIVAETVMDEAVETAVGESAQYATDARQAKKIDGEKQVHAANATFIRTKILLLYLGGPLTKDELYARWECHRIVLKKLYGALPEEDLAQMEESEEQRRAIKKITDDPQGVFNVADLGVSPLWLLWKIYECWGTFYYDYLQEKKHTFNKKQFIEEKRARERYKDEQYLKNLVLSDYPGIRKVLKTEKAVVIQMLICCYKNHPHMEGLLGKDEKETLENMTFYWDNVFDYFLKEYEIWGFEDMEDLSLLAVAFVEPPAASCPDFPDWMGKRDTIKSYKKLGRTTTKNMNAQLKQEYAFRKQCIGQGGGTQVIHYVANTDENLGEGTPLHQLVEIMLHTLNKSRPKYVQENNKAKKWQDFYMSCGMDRKDRVDPNYRVLWKEPTVTDDEMAAMETLRNAIRNELVLEFTHIPNRKKPTSFKVKLVKCNNLDALDKSGTSDPFMVIKFQGTQYKTPHQKKELNPVWNEEFTFNIKRGHKKHLKVKCFDDNKYGRPELIGMESLDVNSQPDGQVSVPLKKRSAFKKETKGRGKHAKFEGAEEKVVSSNSSSTSSWGTN